MRGHDGLRLAKASIALADGARPAQRLALAQALWTCPGSVVASRFGADIREQPIHEDCIFTPPCRPCGPDGACCRRYRAGLREAVARRDHQGAHRIRKARTDPRAQRARPRRRQARASRRLHRLPADRVADVASSRQIGLGDAVHLADARAARRRQARDDRRAARLLFLRCRRNFRRRHLGRHQIVLRRGADRCRTGQRRRARSLRAVPAARASRRRRLHGRLLLHQQRSRRRAMVPRPGCRQGRNPRCRLSSRQRHAGDLLCAAGRAGGQSAWRPDDRIPVLPRPCR